MGLRDVLISAWKSAEPSPFCLGTDAEGLDSGLTPGWDPECRAWAGRVLRSHRKPLLLEGSPVDGGFVLVHALCADEGFWLGTSYLVREGGWPMRAPWEWMGSFDSDLFWSPLTGKLDVVRSVIRAEIPYGNMAALRGSNPLGLGDLPALMRGLSYNGSVKLLACGDSPDSTCFDGRLRRMPHLGEAQLRAAGLRPPDELALEPYGWRRHLGPWGGEDGCLLPCRGPSP